MKPAGIYLLILCGLFSMASAPKFSYDSHGKRDPFFVPAEKSRWGEEKFGASNIKLEGVVVDNSGRPLAIINDDIYGAGERVGGLLIKRIDPKGVYFLNGKEEFMIAIDSDDKS